MTILSYSNWEASLGKEAVNINTLETKQFKHWVWYLILKVPYSTTGAKKTLCCWDLQLIQIWLSFAEVGKSALTRLFHPQLLWLPGANVMLLTLVLLYYMEYIRHIFTNELMKYISAFLLCIQRFVSKVQVLDEKWCNCCPL